MNQTQSSFSLMSMFEHTFKNTLIASPNVLNLTPLLNNFAKNFKTWLIEGGKGLMSSPQNKILFEI